MVLLSVSTPSFLFVCFLSFWTKKGFENVIYLFTKLFFLYILEKVIINLHINTHLAFFRSSNN